MTEKVRMDQRDAGPARGSEGEDEDEGEDEGDGEVEVCAVIAKRMPPALPNLSAPADTARTTSPTVGSAYT